MYLHAFELVKCEGIRTYWSEQGRGRAGLGQVYGPIAQMELGAVQEINFCFSDDYSFSTTFQWSIR